MQAYIIKDNISPKPPAVKAASLSFSRILCMIIKESLIENLSLFHYNWVTLYCFSNLLENTSGVTMSSEMHFFSIGKSIVDKMYNISKKDCTLGKFEIHAPCFLPE